MNDFFKGFGGALSGFTWILRPKIRRFVYIPLAINALLFISAFVLLRQYAGHWVASWIGEKNDWIGMLQWSYDLIVPVLTFVLYAAFVLIAYFLFSSVANLIAAPFNALLSKAVEKRLTSESVQYLEQPLLKEIVIMVKTEIVKLVRFVGLSVLILLLLLIPGLNMLFPIVWFIFMAYVLSLQYVDYPMANHGYYYKEQRQLLRCNRMQRLGFGTAANLMLLVPVVNFIAMPVCVCGATVWWRQHLYHQVEKD
ncbi:MAG: sulfate transporter CysZ [Gammaproteobacteria bacterium]|nr:MAG: sulfate transporter CysZ [Gammaproteobacteria bacterium]